MAKRRITKKPADESAFKDASRGERLQRILADAGVASRRAAEEMIEEGRVAVNGVTVTSLPAWADPEHDHIDIDGRPLPRKRGGHSYLIVNKPRGVICTNEDPQGRKTIIDIVPQTQRLFCVGRLDAESTGLVLLTDDGDLAHRLTHPRFEVPKTYLVTVKGQLGPEEVEKLRKGMYLADRTGGASRAHAESVHVQAADRERTKLTITLREGRNREIRRMLARLGFKVRRLQRLALGPLKLKGVTAGSWRELTRPEVAELRKAAAEGPPRRKQRGKKRPGTTDS